MKDEVVEEEEEGETKEMATADLPQQEEEEDECPVCIEALQKDAKKLYAMCAVAREFTCGVTKESK